jgi:Ca2+-binding RTX toxin-like protein
MASVATGRRLALIAVVVGMLGCVSSASAAPKSTPFGCRASVIRVTLLNNLTTEPYTANTNTTPCKTDSDGVNTAYVPTTGGAAVTSGPAGAFTYNAFDPSFQTAPGAAAVASVKAVNIPTPQGLFTIVGPVESDVSYACVSDKLVGSAQSTLQVIGFQGKTMTLPSPGAPYSISLGGNNYIHVNEKTTTSNSLTERVVHVHLEGIADIVVGEAMVTQSINDPCAGTSGVPPVLEICPPGSVLNAAAQLCEIIITQNGKTTVIIVSRPFKGPTGGRVLALSVARKKYHSPCLKGNQQPHYAVIATKRGGRVEGTLYSDRILGLGKGERIAGLGGNDCIDDIAGTNAKVFDGNGNDKLYAGPGYVRIAAGNGNDYVNGRNGRDYITLGNGNDTVYGGSGNSQIDLGIGHDHVFGGPGVNRIWVAGDYNFVSCGSGTQNIAWLRITPSKYAALHGCQKVILLK